MAGKITNFIRELVLPCSIILTILGVIVLFIGITANWAQDIAKNMFNFSDDILNWWLYFLILGFIIFAAGVWYLYSYLKNRKFILDEILHSFDIVIACFFIGLDAFCIRNRKLCVDCPEIFINPGIHTRKFWKG